MIRRFFEYLIINNDNIVRSARERRKYKIGIGMPFYSYKLVKKELESFIKKCVFALGKPFVSDNFMTVDSYSSFVDREPAELK